jgi:predicted phosphate transport protein (TIGR00153 family)
MRFLPREEKFFHFFLSQVRLISEASILLVEGSRNGMELAAAKVTQLEKEGDAIVQDVFDKLTNTFITPLDPEDIHRLTARLDLILDTVEESSYVIRSYKVHPLPLEAQQMCEIVRSCAKSLQQAFEALSEDKPLVDFCIELNRLENHADTVSRDAIAALFEKEKDPIRVMKLKDVYQLLEAITNHCEHIADDLQYVVVKNS